MRLGLINFGIITVSSIFLFVGCSDCDSWKSTGKDHIGICELSYEDMISADDTLYIKIYGNSIDGDKFDNIDLEIEQDSFSIFFTLYADIYDYTGCHIMPPTNITPDTSIVLLPPFNVGSLHLIANQPLGPDTLGVVSIQP